MKAAFGHAFRHSDSEEYRNREYTYNESYGGGMDVPSQTRTATDYRRQFEPVYTSFIARAFAVMGSDEIFIDINAVGPDINQAGLGRALVYSPNQHDHYRELFDKRFMGFLKDTCGM